ncbi:MAG: hypothetical protein ABI132_12240 [Rhodanobacteraceae bacterium]
MQRFTEKQYRWQLLAAMAIYAAVMLVLYPRAHAASGLPLKVALALSPVPAVVWYVALMARRVLASDELQQRLHLIALGVATMVVGMASIVGGFLAAADVWIIDGSILVWVFPLLCFVYGFAHVGLTRHYTGSLDHCDWRH